MVKIRARNVYVYFTSLRASSGFLYGLEHCQFRVCGLRRLQTAETCPWWMIVSDMFHIDCGRGASPTIPILAG